MTGRWALGLAGLAVLGGVALLMSSTSEDGDPGDPGELEDVSVGKVGPTPPEPIAVGTASQMSTWLGEMRSFLITRGVDVDVLSPEELTYLSRDRVYAIPPKSYWERIIPAAMLFLELRERMGRPLAVRAYRPPAYNASAKGAKGSRHMYFEALDVRDTSGTSAGKRELARAAASLFASNPEAPIGLGIYGKTAPSLHIDASWKRRTWADTKHWIREISA